MTKGEGDMASSALGTILETLKSLADLEIATVVTDAGFLQLDDKGTIKFVAPPEAKQGAAGVYTRINLVGGDILNVVSKAYAPTESNSTSPVMAFHQTQVLASKEVIATNMKTLAELARLAGENFSELLKKPGN